MVLSGFKKAVKVKKSSRGKERGMMRLLVVDDEIDVCDFVKSFFTERNFEVYTAHDGKSAIEMVMQKKPDIVLLDINMPVMDGMAAMKKILDRNEKIKVIMVSAVNDEKAIKEAKDYGVVEFITKPLLLEQLERSVLTIAEQIKMAV